MKKHLNAAGTVASAMVLTTGIIRQASNEGTPLTTAIIASSAVNVMKGLYEMYVTSGDNASVVPVEAEEIDPLDAMELQAIPRTTVVIVSNNTRISNQPSRNIR